MTKSMTQCEKIFEHLLNRGSITARQAYHMGIMRLASRISDLKKDPEINRDYLIKTEPLKVKNRDGSTSYVAKYLLIKREEVKA